MQSSSSQPLSHEFTPAPSYATIDPSQWRHPRHTKPDRAHQEDSLLRSLDTVLERAQALRQFTEAHRQPSPDREATAPFGARSRGIVESIEVLLWRACAKPQVFAHHYAEFARQWLEIIQGNSTRAPARDDLRFRDVVWRDNPFYRGVLQCYLTAADELHAWIDDLGLEPEDRRRTQFLLDQFIAALSPTNTLLNPVVVKRAYQTGGKSLLDGMQRWIADLKDNDGMPRQTRLDAFDVGSDLACSAGKVVYRCDMFELIQYQPRTERVQQRPLLLTPPQINKFYIFDLNPRNSLIGFLLDQGLQVFVISWRMPNRQHAHWGLDNYVQELAQATSVVRDISGSDSVNLLGACAGGLTSTALLAYLQASGRHWINSLSLFVTSLQASGESDIELFITRETAERARQLTQRHGVMEGRHLAHLFAWLRPTDLVWNFFVNNYLLGKDPPALDVLYWDHDNTRLPAQLHSDFIDIYVGDLYARSGALTICGHPVDLRGLKQDCYVVAGDEDYLMPWRGCYRSTLLFGGHCRFVLSNSGHIQSVLRPPGIANTHYWVGEVSASEPDQWQQSATQAPGSWWGDWASWLSERSGPSVEAPQSPGSDEFPPLGDAPGDYVRERC